MQQLISNNVRQLAFSADCAELQYPSPIISGRRAQEGKKR
jgi:hypothetical protein